MKETFIKFKPILFLSLKVWLLYVFMAAMQDLYHEVNCEGGYNGFLDYFMYGLGMFLFIALHSLHTIVILCLFYFLLKKIKLSKLFISILFICGSALICLISYPVLYFLKTYYDIDQSAAEIFSDVFRGVLSHYLISSNFISAPLCAIILFAIQRHKILATLTKIPIIQKIN